MTDNKDSYKEAFRATSIFGGVQVFNVLVSIIRSKVIAVLLGTGGMGISEMLQRPLSIIGLLAEMGLGQSSIRDITKAQTSGDENKISRTIKTVKRWVWMTGILGMSVVIVLSPLLNKWTNANSNYTWAFLLLSVTLLFSALTGGQTAILRGLRKIKETAKIGLLGSSLGLILSIPFYYLYGIKGIVPSLIIYSLIGLLTSWYYSKKIPLTPVTISYKESFFQGREMIKLGFILTFSNIFSQIISYLIVLYVNYRSGEGAVGLFNAGSIITNRYVALIFTAMTVDYFPRLISLQSDREKMKAAVNHQAEIALLIITPMMILFLSFLPLVIQLIYTKNFLPVIDYVQWMILGMLFKAASWAFSHIIVAKGDNRLFLFTEISGNIINLILNVTGYTLWGLNGIGIAFVLQYIVYFIIVALIAKRKYQISFTNELNKLFIFQLALSSLCFLVVKIKGYPLMYIAGSVLFIISAIYSLKKLNNKLDLKTILKNRRL